MNLPDVPLMSMLKSKMSWLEARQDVLSQNVANAARRIALRDCSARAVTSALRSS